MESASRRSRRTGRIRAFFVGSNEAHFPIAQAPARAACAFACQRLVAALAGGVVFWIWYSPPYAALAGGLGLFGLLVTVDVVMGPMLTAVAASPRKPVSELRRDLALIVLLRGRLSHTGCMSSPWRGRYTWPSRSTDSESFSQLIRDGSIAGRPGGSSLAALARPPPDCRRTTDPPGGSDQSHRVGNRGFDLSLVPEFCGDPAHAAEAWNRARPLKILLEHYPQQISSVARIEKHARQDVGSLRFLPVVSRRESWSAVVAGPDARIVGFLRVDGFI